METGGRETSSRWLGWGRAAAGVLGKGWWELELAGGYSGPQARVGDGRARKTLKSPKIIRASERSAPGAQRKTPESQGLIFLLQKMKSWKAPARTVQVRHFFTAHAGLCQLFLLSIHPPLPLFLRALLPHSTHLLRLGDTALTPGSQGFVSLRTQFPFAKGRRLSVCPFCPVPALGPEVG